MELRLSIEKLDLLACTSSPPSSTNNLNQSKEPEYSATTSSRQHEPQQPLFVGHTQSAFSLDAAKASLSLMGIPPNPIDPTCGLQSLTPSTESTPERSPIINLTPEPLSSIRDPLLAIALPEVRRLITVFHEEIEALYPFINSDELVVVADMKLKELARQMGIVGSDSRLMLDMSEDKDINILKVAVAIAVVIEPKAQVTRSSDVDLRDLQQWEVRKMMLPFF
ncbi:hypothetical protein F4801DRAFT_572403 [Xylaria longipes]|nr:hypothetical protein F4801DRAFT_572403 [Xylaria longipes]